MPSRLRPISLLYVSLLLMIMQPVYLFQNVQTFSIDIQLGKNENTTRVRATGTDRHFITDSDKQAFGLSNEQLTDLVATYMGKKPHDVFFGDPTPWGNVYSEFGWTPVTTVMNTVRSEVLNTNIEPVILARKQFINNADVNASFSSSISYSTENTVEMSWSETTSFTLGQAVEYKIEPQEIGVGGQTSFSFSKTFGQDSLESQAVTITDQSGISVDLDPGQEADLVISASKGLIKVRIYFSVYLEGYVFANYKHKFNGHHFYPVSISSLNITSQPIIEDITILYYSEGKVEMELPSKQEALHEEEVLFEEETSLSEPNVGLIDLSQALTNGAVL